MKPKRFSVISLLVAVCLIGLLAIVFSSDGFETKADREAKALEQRIHELVQVGMDINESIEILRADGIHVTDYYDPAKEKDRWYVVISLRRKISFLDKVKYTIGKGKMNKYFVSILVNCDGVITSIE